MMDTPRIKDLIKKAEIDTLKEAMEQGIDEGCQTFDYVLLQLYKAKQNFAGAGAHQCGQRQ